MRADAISLIETAYDLRGDLAAWTRRITVASAALRPGRSGVASMVWAVADGEVRIVHADATGLPALDVVAATRPRTLDARVRDLPPIALASKRTGHMIRELEAVPVSASFAARHRVTDLLGVHGRADHERGIVISFALVDDERVTKREERMWTRLAIHVGTALRLRHQLQRDAPIPDAVLEPNGRVVHAEIAASSKGSREELATAARLLDRARGQLRRSDPDEAVELWRALVRGEWSLVDRFDSDGRRYLIAHRNAACAEVRDARLTEREARAAELVARGYSNKLIGYELGLAASTIGGLLASACRKLGAESTLELITASRARSRGGSRRCEA